MTLNKEKEAENILRVSGVNARRCMKCGKCSASCPAFEEMDISPHRVVAAVLDGETEELLSSESLWKCMSCFACVERCPRGVEPANIIEGARVTVLRRQGGNRFTPEQVPELLNERIPQQAITSAFRKYSK